VGFDGSVAGSGVRVSVSPDIRGNWQLSGVATPDNRQNALTSNGVELASVGFDGSVAGVGVVGSPGPTTIVHLHADDELDRVGRHMRTIASGSATDSSDNSGAPRGLPRPVPA
jgi:hypothetical protein